MILFNCDCAGNVGICVGHDCGESDRIDSAGAAHQPWPTGSHLLPSCGANLHLRLPRAHHERRVHRCPQLWPIHSQGRAMERPYCDGGIFWPHRHRALHPRCCLRPLGSMSGTYNQTMSRFISRHMQILPSNSDFNSNLT